jgi:hypothetical protein
LNYTGDAVQLKIADPEGRFRWSQHLVAANPVTLSIQANNWRFPGDVVNKQCGVFYIHEIRMRQTKPGGTIMDISCSSIPLNGSRLEKRGGAYESTTMSAIVAKVAQDNGLSPKFEGTDVKIERADKYDQGDLTFLKRHAEQNDYCVKIKDNTLWVTDFHKLEAQAPVGAIFAPGPMGVGGVNGQGGITSWEWRDCTEDCYGQCKSNDRERHGLHAA